MSSQYPLQPADETIHARGDIFFAQGAVGDAEIAGAAEPEGIAGDGGDLVFAHQAGDDIHGIEVAVEPRQQVEGALGGGHIEPVAELRQPVEAHLAHGVDAGQMVAAIGGAGGQRAERRSLRYHRRADEDGVLDLFQRAEQVARRDQVADPPTGEAISFGKGEQRDGVPAAVG